MSTPYTQRVEVDAYYTDGEDLWCVVDVCDLGMVSLRSSGTGENGKGGRPRDVGIDAFRRQFWLVRGPENELAKERQ